MGADDFRGLTGDALEAELLGLRRQERQLEVQVLRALIEAERRRLDLDRGYGSLFAYCVERLGYCESAAGRCPRLEPMLLAGEVHVSTVAMAAKAIRRDERILDEIRGRTQRQVEEVLARLAPGRDGASWEFEFTAGPRFKEKYERVRALLSGKHPEGLTPEQVFEATLDEYLRRHDPARERSPRGSAKTRGAPRWSRSIPAALRRAVWRRDGGRCTFAGPDGRRCGSTWDVEIDHVHRLENLRLLCAARNRRRAERDLGTAWRAPFTRPALTNTDSSRPSKIGP